MPDQKDLIPPDPPPKPRGPQCWKCAVDRVEILSDGGATLGFQCPRCHRFTPTGQKQPIKAPK